MSFDLIDHKTYSIRKAIEAQRLKTLRQVMEWMEGKVSWGLEAKALRAVIKAQGIFLEEVGDGV